MNPQFFILIWGILALLVYQYADEITEGLRKLFSRKNRAPRLTMDHIRQAQRIMDKNLPNRPIPGSFVAVNDVDAIPKEIPSSRFYEYPDGRLEIRHKIPGLRTSLRCNSSTFID